MLSKNNATQKCPICIEKNVGTSKTNEKEVTVRECNNVKNLNYFSIYSMITKKLEVIENFNQTSFFLRANKRQSILKIWPNQFVNL